MMPLIYYRRKLDGQQQKIETEFPTSTMFLFDIQITLYLYP